MFIYTLFLSEGAMKYQTPLSTFRESLPMNVRGPLHEVCRLNNDRLFLEAAVVTRLAVSALEKESVTM